VAGQEPLVRRGREPIAGAPGATTAARPPHGSASAGPTTPRWPGRGHPTTQSWRTRWPGLTSWVPPRPRRGPAADERTGREGHPARAASPLPGPRRPGWPPASRKSWRCWPTACRTGRSRNGCSSPSGPCTITSPRCCPRSASRHGPRQRGRPRGWASGP